MIRRKLVNDLSMYSFSGAILSLVGVCLLAFVILLWAQLISDLGSDSGDHHNTRLVRNGSLYERVSHDHNEECLVEIIMIVIIEA